MGRRNPLLHIVDAITANGWCVDKNLAQHHEENREQQQPRRHLRQEHRQAFGFLIHGQHYSEALWQALRP